MGIYMNGQSHTIQFSGTKVHLRGLLDVLVSTENNVQYNQGRERSISYKYSAIEFRTFIWKHMES